MVTLGFKPFLRLLVSSLDKDFSIPNTITLRFYFKSKQLCVFSFLNLHFVVAVTERHFN